MTKKSNLCIHPWIPVLLQNGNTSLVSLEGLYEQAENIRDLVLSPIERISVMRLLICITQRALNGPADAEEKEECQADVVPKSLEYLRKWQHAFELYGEHGAFLQTPGLSSKAEDELTPFSKLALSLASGNNPTLFDNAGGSNRSFPFSHLAINLLTFQNFSTGGLISQITWNGKQTAKSAISAPCVAGSALHLFLIGAHMLETIWMNLCPKDQIPETLSFGFGEPIWELNSDSWAADNTQDKISRSYLGRLVPLSRCIQFHNEGILLGEGLKFPVFGDDKNVLYWEPSMRRRIDKQGNTKLVSTDLHRALWRDLPAMLESFNGSKHWIYDNEQLPEQFSVWIGGLEVDKASIHGEAESCFPDSSTALFSEQAINGLKASLEQAEQAEKRLCAGICSYHSFMGNDFEKKQIMGNDFEKKQKDLYLSQGKSIFWKHLSSNQHLFLQTASLTPTSKEAWAHLCNLARLQAYDYMCPHSTARQMEAWAKGRYPSFS